jgi:hypothetical protein
MADYGIKNNAYEIVNGSAYLFPSGALSNHTTAISASIPQIVAITCSANYNDRLTKLTTLNAYGIITLTSGSSNLTNDTTLVLRYIKENTEPELIYTSSDSTINHLLGGINTNITYIDIPLKRNDDSFLVAYRTVNALTKAVGYNKIFSASLVDDGSGIENLSASLGDNMSIGSSFKVRNSSSLYGLNIDYGVSSSGFFKIYSLNSGSVANPNFEGTTVQVGGMMVGTTFKIGEADPVFYYNIVQSGSGNLNQTFYEGDKILFSASLGIKLDPNDSTSALITGSNASASMYFSGSGKIGFGTANPQTDFDVRADEFQVQQRRDLIGVRVNEEGNFESFNKSTLAASTGSEFILKYSRGGTGAITAALINDFFGSVVIAADASQADIDNYTSDLQPDTLLLLLIHGEKRGILSTRAQAGDILGSIRWVMDSGSSDIRYFDERQTGEALKIEGKVATATDAGVTGDMSFLVATSPDESPTEIMKIGADGNVRITGSLYISNGSYSTLVSSSVIYSSGSNIFGDAISDTQTFNGHITASGNISSSGNIIGTIDGGSF